jgi:hypothetical protein
MDIQQSIISQAVYGENGRAALPLRIFMEQSKNGQVGGKKKIEHLGVPMVLALVNVNINKPCNNISERPIDQMVEYLPEDFENRYENESTRYIADQHSKELQPISDEVYNSLFNTVLDEPISYESYNNEYPYIKKYTRKNRT